MLLMILTFLFLLSVLWRRLILKHNGTITNHLDVSSLSKVTDGYTPGHMVTANFFKNSPVKLLQQYAHFHMGSNIYAVSYVKD
jgi:hypothetical protein